MRVRRSVLLLEFLEFGRFLECNFDVRVARD